ncbi:permease [Sulfurovum lithotrophicum]|uniref:Probable membrane transporter protein n=1 Tax=Sulfurovum lithotrophicum TaxID=206403 RepID=A0A7U4M2H5_9BACT|nr:sulfite exporter TauE/SafE family protein [Sulfurovum lithotrophicum]AKF25674.1 permease [Sulfurovum lithotrophicum]
MNDYLLYSSIAFVLSTVFSMGGTGSGIALIPVLNFFGIEFIVAKATGLFAGASTTITSSIMNIKRKVLDFSFIWPIALMMLIFAPIGAYSSQFINESLVKSLFILLLFYSATMMIFGKKKSLTHTKGKAILFIVGAFVGFLAGLLGVGGGNILMPLLILLGFDSKKVAVTVSSVVPFAALSSFLTYASYVKLDWILLICVMLASIAGGYIGNYLMHFKLDQAKTKKLMGAILYILAIKMLYKMLF